MNQTSYSNKSLSRLVDVKKQSGTIPVIRRNMFVYGYLALLILYGAFLLPANGGQEILGKVIIVVFGF